MTRNRTVALPQPNYASFMGKGNLDVYKLEKIDYGHRCQRIWMLTVHSPNRSALCDDGYVSFRSSADGRQTIVTFLACQFSRSAAVGPCSPRSLEVVEKGPDGGRVPPFLQDDDVEYLELLSRP